MLPVVDSKTSSRRCSGHCCRDFTLPFNPGQLLRLGRDQRALNTLKDHPDVQVVFPSAEGEDYHFRTKSIEGAQLVDRVLRNVGVNGFKGHVQYIDIETISDMAIPGSYKTDEGLKRSFDKDSERAVRTEMKHHYSCKHQRANGDCGIYERRPRMCSDYPYGRTCDQIGCTAQEGDNFTALPSASHKAT